MNFEEGLIKEVRIFYCEQTGKYDVIINGTPVGKHYTIQEAMSNRSLEELRGKR